MISKIGEVRFLMRGLAISPPRFSKYCKTAIPPEFSEKKKIWREILVWSPYHGERGPKPLVGKAAPLMLVVVCVVVFFVSWLAVG